jgi:hypothetical protein
MKKLMILGAMIGFASGLVLGAVNRAPWPDVIWRACVACFVASFLFRWWGRMWLHSLRTAQIERQAAELKQAPSANV